MRQKMLCTIGRHEYRPTGLQHQVTQIYRTIRIAVLGTLGRTYNDKIRHACAFGQELRWIGNAIAPI